MRQSRKRNDGRTTVYEASNDFVGVPGELFLPSKAVRKLKRIMRQLSEFYVLDILSEEITERGYTITCVAPSSKPDRQTVEARFVARYGARRAMPDFGDKEVYRHWAERLRDISCFFRDLDQMFSQWYNGKLMEGKRKGTVWIDRFRSVIIAAARNLLEKALGINIDIVGDPRERLRRAKLCKRTKKRWERFLQRHPLLADLPEITGEVLALLVPLVLPYQPRRP